MKSILHFEDPVLKSQASHYKCLWTINFDETIRIIDRGVAKREQANWWCKITKGVFGIQNRFRFFCESVETVSSIIYTGETFPAETVPSDSHFFAYECESLKIWFCGDSDSVAKQFSDSDSPSETFLDRIWICNVSMRI